MTKDESTDFDNLHQKTLEEVCCQVGASTSLRAQYNIEPLSWLNEYVVIFASGKNVAGNTALRTTFSIENKEKNPDDKR